MTQLPQAKYRRDYQAPEYTVTDISLDFQLDAHTTKVTAKSKFKRLINNDIPLSLQGENIQLISLEVDGKSWPYYQKKESGLQIDRLPEQFTLTIVNEIYPAKNTALEGLYQSGEALCTQCEAEGFRHITYYLDRPDVLARFDTRITADKKQYPYLLSNGNKIASGELENGRHWVHWQDPFPKPSYLFAIVAGDFDVLHDVFVTRSGREVDLALYVDRGNLDRAGWAMKSLQNAMKWDEDRFGLEYDLDIYMIVAVDFFNMGAMENKGLNVFNSKFVLAKSDTATDRDYLAIEAVIGHEYFHNWTGNRVTCRDWFQLSLKEGLTVFRDQEFSADLGSRAVNRIDAVKVLRSAQFAEDSGPMAHPIRPDKVIEMNNFYTVTVYEKGAEVIRMMHTLLGEARFQAGMRLYISRHDGSAATCDDFIRAMQEASGIDLTLFGRWYSQSGTPHLCVKDSYDEASQKYTLSVTQFTPPTQDQLEKLPLHIPLDIELYYDDGSIVPLISEGKTINNVLNVTAAEQTFVFEDVAKRPIISLLRDFSAPVKLDYPYTDDRLIFLIQHATNDFARWDAAQMLLVKHIKQNVSRHQRNMTIELSQCVIDAFTGVLLSQQLDPALMALLITLPSEREIAEWFDVIDPDAIHAVHRKFKRLFAENMFDELLAIYLANGSDGSYEISGEDIAKRSLKNACLSYLAYGAEEVAARLVENQYRHANNMTDSLAALAAAVDAELPCCEALLTDFDERWHSDGLVMDKWFMLQSGRSDCYALERVRTLLNHRSFSMANPNRIRALVGGFTTGNPYRFNAKEGSGYQFLVEILTDLNDRNPQVASRLIEPLLRFKRYDAERQRLMRNALEALKALKNLSRDLFEKIAKALAS